MNSRHSPMVCILKITAVCPLPHLHSKGILTFFKQVSDVEFARKAAVLRITDLLAIHPHLMTGIDTSEVKDDPTAFPFLRYGKGTHIRADRIISEDVWRTTLERIVGVGVYRIAMTLHFPTAWHLKVIPCRHVIPFFEKILGRLVHIFREVELPDSVKRGHAGICSVIGQGTRLICIRV